jgi:multidrug efflux pump subunit AcrB
VYLRDVAIVEIGATKPRAYGLLDGKPVVSLMIQPTGSVPPSKLRVALEETLVEIRKGLPQGLKLNVTFDFTRNLEPPTPATASEYLVVDLQLPDKTTGERRLPTLEQCEAEARKVPGVEHVLALTEHPFDLFGTDPCLVVLLNAAKQRQSGREETIGMLRAKLASVKETTVRVRDLSFPGSWPRCGYSIDLALHGPDREKVRQWSTLLQDRLASSKKFTDLWVSPEPPLQLQFEVEIDATLAERNGVQWRDVLDATNLILDKKRTEGFYRFGSVWHADISSEPRPEEVEKGIANAKIPCATGEMIPVSTFVKVNKSKQPPVLDLLGGQPMVQFSANLAPGVSAEQGRKLCEAIAEETRREIKLPAEYRLTWLQ